MEVQRLAEATQVMRVQARIWTQASISNVQALSVTLSCLLYIRSSSGPLLAKELQATCSSHWSLAMIEYPE